MLGPNKEDTRPVRAVRAAGPKSPNRDPRPLYMLLIGLVAGSLLTLMVGYGLIAGGYLSTGSLTCPPSESVCPATPAFLPVCPTCGMTIVTRFAPTFTPTATSTPDAAATATAACDAFESQFPGTPCPSQP
jgi:hypothetical protein